jgi:hypothetical protein
MKHFVQYHNTEKMGYSATQALKEKGFFILTRKRMNPDTVIGQIVWLFSGEGKMPNKRFYLVVRFTVTGVGPASDPDFLYEIRGEEGKIFDPPIEVTQIDWFKSLKRARNNFSLGFGEIKDPMILKALTQEYS